MSRYKCGVLTAGLVVLAWALAGCASSHGDEANSGFLSDYSRLQQTDSRTRRYIAPDPVVRGYRTFLVEPVEVRPVDGGGGASEAELRRAAQVAQGELVEQLEAGYFVIGQVPAAGTARVRAAITGYDRSEERVSIEAELVDSISGEQIMATVSNRLRSPSLERSMAMWAERLRLRLERVHGLVPTAARAEAPEPVGFLSSYNNLEARGPSSLAYLAPSNRLARYDKFIVEPVQTYFYTKDLEISKSSAEGLQEHMRAALVDALDDRYQIVNNAGPDVGVIRVALTDVKRSSPVLNVIPRGKLASVGLGGMSMEAEIVDSLSGFQVAALVESATGRNLSWDPSFFDDARAACDDWAKRARRVIDDSRAR